VQISVRLHGSWGSVLPGGRSSAELSVPEGSIVAHVLRLLKVEDTAILVAVNGEHVDADHPLQEHDKLQLFFPVEGG